MIVCSCNVLSDGQIRACVNPGPGCPRTAADVYECLGCSPKCGRCARTIRAIVAHALGGPEVVLSSCATECAATCPLGKVAHSHDHVAHEHDEIRVAPLEHATGNHHHHDLVVEAVTGA